MRSNRKNNFGFLAIGFLLSFLSQAFAEEALHLPELTGPVVDEVGLLTEPVLRELEPMIREMNRQDKAQLSVAVVKSLDGLSIEEYGIKLGEKWKLGNKGSDRGLILIVAPTDRKMRLEVGYGLEGEIPDVVARRVLDEVIKPFFKEGEYGQGILVGVFQIGKILGLDLSHVQEPRGGNQGNSGMTEIPSKLKGRSFLALFFGVILLGPIGGAICGFILGFLLFGLIGGVGGLVVGGLFGLAARWGMARGGGGFGGGWGGGGGWTSGGDGGFGGGWSGGGGGFGGGGSSSSW